MAISIQPVDGLINRLLQQNSKPSSVARQSAPAAAPKQDQVSISSSAYSQKTPTTESQVQSQQQQNKPGERALESHLLNLYKKNDTYGG
ncbi:MAG: hypothetical protein Q9M16_09135 [Mariprofundus sp.]|nr:hypothetical protein [Mariprofundus sp.]